MNVQFKVKSCCTAPVQRLTDTNLLSPPLAPSAQRNPPPPPPPDPLLFECLDCTARPVHIPQCLLTLMGPHHLHRHKRSQSYHWSKLYSQGVRQAKQVPAPN